MVIQDSLTLIGTHTSPYTGTLKANKVLPKQGIQMKGQINQRISKTLVKHEAGSEFHYDHADRFQHRDTYTLSDQRPALFEEGARGAAGNRLDAARAASVYARTTVIMEFVELAIRVRGEHIESYRTDWGSTDPDRTGLNVSERSNERKRYYQFEHQQKFGSWNIYWNYRGMTPAGSKNGVLPERSTNSEIGIQSSKLPFTLTFFTVNTKDC